MRFVIFTHSLVSDWNHGNAHFLRGVITELQSRGHDVKVYEPRDGWSRKHLWRDRGSEPIRAFHRHYPTLQTHYYEPEWLDRDEALDGADVVIVHEWNDPELVRRIGEHHAYNPGYRLFFHDTHHRGATAPKEMAKYDLAHYDGVLAFGKVLRDLYLKRGWTRRAWTWHEAADTRVFHPINKHAQQGDLVWIGNWGDDERAEELEEFLLKPVRDLGLRAKVYGVRYPKRARKALKDAGIEYDGWLPNYQAPRVFSQFRVTVHVPRRPYTKALPGIPTIRPFEALACGIPLVTAPWDDVERLFTPGEDFLVAKDGNEMKHHLKTLLENPDRARLLAAHGRRTLLARHTCEHRVDELIAITESLATPDERSLMERKEHSTIHHLQSIPGQPATSAA